MSDYSIREARPEDFDPIIRLWESIDRHTALPDRPEYLEAFHSFSPDLLLVAEAEGRIVGTVIGGWDGWRANIARLATSPQARRKGIAVALVREIERRLLAKGARRVYALVDKRSPPAIPFWEAAGYAFNDNILQYSRNFEEGCGPVTPTDEVSKSSEPVMEGISPGTPPALRITIGEAMVDLILDANPSGEWLPSATKALRLRWEAVAFAAAAVIIWLVLTERARGLERDARAELSPVLERFHDLAQRMGRRAEADRTVVWLDERRTVPSDVLADMDALAQSLIGWLQTCAAKLADDALERKASSLLEYLDTNRDSLTWLGLERHLALLEMAAKRSIKRREIWNQVTSVFDRLRSLL